MNYQFKSQKYKAIVREVSTGEEQIIEFHAATPDEYLNNSEFAKGILQLTLDEAYGKDILVIDSIEVIPSVVSIEIDPICPN
jgi:hypothetical protein